MPLNIKIDNFEGPFDLLLHLIKKNEMDIYDIKIYKITNQYIEYVEKMKELDLEITSEFIVMAATLLEIKSRLLLPKNNSNDEDAADEDIDPTKQLVQKLVEYKKFKAAACYLKEKMEYTGICFSKKPEIIEEKEKTSSLDLFKDMSIVQLYNIYLELMERYFNKMNTPNNIEKKIMVDTFKIEDKMKQIEEIVKEDKVIPFSNIINNCDAKIEKIVIFLALLELIRLRVVDVFQENNFNEIYLERSNKGEKDGYKADGD